MPSRISSEDAILKDSFDGKDVLSALSFAAETITCQIKHKNQWKFVAAVLSICYECYIGASTDLCVSKVFAFLMKMAPFLTTKFRESHEDHNDRNIILGAWVTMLTFLSQDCTKRIHSLKTGINDSFKLMVKIISSCMEEVVALARLVYEIKGLGEDKDSTMLHLSVYKHCVKCFQDTFHDVDIQVQTIGLHVLKTIAQREVSNGTDMEMRSFFCTFAGELFGDIFLIIQNSHKGGMKKETTAALEECVRLFFLTHTLSQGSEFQQAITTLLVEALVMVFSIADESHSQEANVIKATARKLVSHLVQTPSFAIQIKDVMVSMQIAQRQKLQDIIRMSVMPGQMATSTQVQVPSVSHGSVAAMQSNPIIAPPFSKFNKHSEIDTTEHSHLEAPDVEVRDASNHGGEAAGADAEDDDDDDWDTFQSLPANDTVVSTSELHVEVGSDRDIDEIGSVRVTDEGATNTLSGDAKHVNTDADEGETNYSDAKQVNQDMDEEAVNTSSGETKHVNAEVDEVVTNTLSSDTEHVNPDIDNEAENIKGGIDTIDLQQKDNKDTDAMKDSPSGFEIFEEVSHANDVMTGQEITTSSSDQDMETPDPKHDDEGTIERIEFQQRENKDVGESIGISSTEEA